MLYIYENNYGNYFQYTINPTKLTLDHRNIKIK